MSLKVRISGLRDILVGVVGLLSYPLKVAHRFYKTIRGIGYEGLYKKEWDRSARTTLGAFSSLLFDDLYYMFFRAPKGLYKFFTGRNVFGDVRNPEGTDYVSALYD